MTPADKLAAVVAKVKQARFMLFHKDSLENPLPVIALLDDVVPALAELQRAQGLTVRIDEVKFLRDHDTHYHNTFEPDNCDCLFCERLTALLSAPTPAESANGPLDNK
jgi:hypothetical protein